jgi:orotidine-5'-phosphate decarboxylase
LTSLEAADLSALGIGRSPVEQVLLLAEIARQAGLDGVVTAGSELDALRRRFGEDWLLVVPGIRPAGAAANDQARTLTPREAADAGADYLVVGRPITGAEDPAAATRAIQQTLRLR